jgi:ubiquinone biosynthesis protein
MRDFRVYRLLRVGLALALVLPRYWRLLAYERFAGRPAGQDRWDAAHRAAAGEIRRLALSLRGGLVKVAQIAGARADVLPKPFIEELSQFHDDVPPRPFEVLRATVESELAAPLDSIFASVDPTPLPSAPRLSLRSIAPGSATARTS